VLNLPAGTSSEGLRKALPGAKNATKALLHPFATT
jgi:hypothetical protein